MDQGGLWARGAYRPGGPMGQGGLWARGPIGKGGLWAKGAGGMDVRTYVHTDGRTLLPLLV